VPQEASQPWSHACGGSDAQASSGGRQRYLGRGTGGTFGCLLPYLLGDWHVHRPLPHWGVAQAAGGLLIGAGLVPVVQSFAKFTKADGTPLPVASPPRLVVGGFYRYVRTPSTSALWPS
jgi:hypothetical protein